MAYCKNVSSWSCQVKGCFCLKFCVKIYQLPGLTETGVEPVLLKLDRPIL